MYSQKELISTKFTRIQLFCAICVICNLGWERFYFLISFVNEGLQLDRSFFVRSYKYVGGGIGDRQYANKGTLTF